VTKRFRYLFERGVQMRLSHRLVVTVPAEMSRAGALIVGLDLRDMSWFSHEFR
jgi:hypothetical protein